MLELCLIIAMKHLITLSEGDSFNFEMVYQGILESSLALSLPIMLWEIFPPSPPPPTSSFKHNFYKLKIMCKIMTLTMIWDSKNYPSLWKTVCNCSKTLTKDTATLNLAMASNSAFYPLFLHQFISQGIKLIRFLVYLQNIKSLLKRKDLQFNLLKNRLF